MVAVFEKPELKNFWSCFSPKPQFNGDSFIQLYQDTDDETVLKILARFHETLGQCSKNLTEGNAKNDSDVIWKASHKVAGSAELLGFKQYGDVAREFSLQVKANPEITCYETDLREFMVLTEQLRQDISKSCPNLSSYLS